MLSHTEENYIKTIFHLSDNGKETVSTNAIADNINTTAASVTDMIKKLASKELLNYRKYKGVFITALGREKAIHLIRRHRLWESFLVTKLKFNWDEVHDVAEELEHIRSPLLISRLDEFLGKPRIDPHGDPIPNENGEFPESRKIPLSEWETGKSANISGVKDSSPSFLQYLDKIGISIGTSIEICAKVDFDGSLELQIDQDRNVFISRQVSENLLVS